MLTQFDRSFTTMPPLENMSSKVLPGIVTETMEDDALSKKGFANHGDVVEQVAAIRSLEIKEKLPRGSLEDFVIEPKTGFKFPIFLTPDRCKEGSNCASSTQVLAGVGIRSLSIIKLTMIKIYAFGFYLKPDCMRAQLGDKYGAVPPEELKLKSTFYEDLLRHELDMSVRLIVHHKRVRLGMVRSAFESSLKNRLKKLKGVDDDEGLRVFCSYFSEDLSLPAGTVIDFHWQPGGQFHTTVGDRFMGTIFSLDFCRAFFDLYIGDPPVCSKAKQDIGLKLGHMFRDS